MELALFIMLSLYIGVASQFSQYSIWLFLLIIVILQIIITFLLFDFFTKKFG